MTLPLSVKILLVDDLDENLFALEVLLRREGLEFLRARSGREALELLLIHDVGLALLDVQMPEMDGFELAELMRGSARTRRVPIIFLTAGASDSQRVFHGYEVGAVDFLSKPIDPILLGHKVTTFADLHRQRLELREMLRLHEMFVAAISHDLRQPLGVVVLSASLLEHQSNDPNAKQNLARLRSGAQRMTGMLDQLYDLARARLSGGIPLELAETDVRPIVERVAQEFRAAHPERTVVVDYDDGSTTGMWDEQRLGQVLANLIGNAVRHGTRDEAVQLRVRAASGTLVIEVQNGGAIPDALLSCLFDPFRSGKRASREGLGLGLYIVRQIVEAHDGTIQVHSSVETGVTFRVEIPKAPRAVL
jgi:two-component system sensor histidine kinase/response regulator